MTTSDGSVPSGEMTDHSAPRPAAVAFAAMVLPPLGMVLLIGIGWYLGGVVGELTGNPAIGPYLGVAVMLGSVLWRKDVRDALVWRSE